MSDINMQEVSDSAKAWFDKLMTYYSTQGISPFDNFWWLGNCFDTITDYLLVFNASDPTNSAAMAAILAKYRWTREKHDQAVTVDTWYDDWAWWAIASAKAFDPRYAKVFGSDTPSFIEVAAACWAIVDRGLGDGVHLGAPNAYTNRENLTKWLPPPPVPKNAWYAPLFDGDSGSGLHGTWQYLIFSNRRERPRWTGPLEGNDESNPSWPFAPTWGGPFQLTVMNALYLLLTARLEQARRHNPGVPPAARQLADELGFLWAWFGKDSKNPLPDGVPGLLYPAGDGVVVRERVSRYAFYGGAYNKIYMFDEQCTWGGDIGLVLNGLATCNTLRPDIDPERPVASLMKELVLGYIGLLFGGRAPQPCYPPGEGVFGLDPDDYRSGIGVFMRGLYQAFQQDHSPLWELLKPYETVRDFLRYSGEWALKQTITKETDAFDCLNVIATLTAVAAIPH